MDGLAGVVSGLQASHHALVAERNTVNGQIAAFESALAAMGAVSSSRNGKAATSGSPDYRPGSLKAHIQRVLSDAGGALPVADITAGVIRSGFKSKNKTLGTSVGIALADMSTVRRVKRGVYAVR